jgi:hypothetical protein
MKKKKLLHDHFSLIFGHAKSSLTTNGNSDRGGKWLKAVTATVS